MFAKWKNSWVVGTLAIVVTVICVIWLWNMPREKSATSKGLFPPMSSAGLKVGNALAYHAAEETAGIFGSDGGSAVLVVPEDLTPVESTQQSLRASYKEGFLEALQRHPKIQLTGVIDGTVSFRLDLATLQDIRKTYPQSGVIVSFVGLPQLTPTERQTWLASNPPKLIVIEFLGLTNRDEAEALLANGLVDVIFAFNRPPPYTGNPTREDYFRQSVDVLRRP